MLNSLRLFGLRLEFINNKIWCQQKKNKIQCDYKKHPTPRDLGFFFFFEKTDFLCKRNKYLKKRAIV